VIIGGERTLSNETSAIKEFQINKYPDITHPHIFTYIKDSIINEGVIVKRKLYGYGFNFFLRALKHPWFMFKYLLRAVGLPWNT
jgi:hypothetical protein